MNSLDVDVIETHAALIFLAGKSAYKIKKAVIYPYLDFSTLGKRKAACDRELEINQPHAPQIYLNVVPICQADSGKLNIGGPGNVVEWAIHMHRFSDDALLARVIDDGRAEAPLFITLADEITRYHDKAQKVVDATGAKRISAIIAELCDAFGSANNIIGARQHACFSTELERQLESMRHRLDERSQRGYVRRCHGDLHLHNIVVLDGKPVLFDAIEFDEEMATIDVLYDLAFLIMDLEVHHLRREANIVLNRYIADSTDVANIAGLQALPLFLACRAGIRAMVALTRLGQAKSETARAQAREDVTDYFASALQFLERPPPQLICIGGLSGTGKTTIARLLAPQFGSAPGALHLRSDVERKMLFGVPETQHLGASAYTSEVSEKVYGSLMHKAKLALLAGSSVIVDAVFLNEAERDHAQAVARDAGASFDGIWLEANERTMIERVTDRTGDASDADAAIVRKQLKKPTGNISWHRIIADGTLDQTLSNCADTLNQGIAKPFRT
ncbi:MAG: AAA family ATPase [Hyphomicrobiales bacterium]|nr:AAA family ATPase [Hyphomicrobiales bacterium]